MNANHAHDLLLSHEAVMFSDCDPLVRPIVHALADGSELPEKFVILDTYADVGDPPSVWHCETIRRQVRQKAGELGIKMRTTHTCLDSSIAIDD